MIPVCLYPLISIWLPLRRILLRSIVSVSTFLGTAIHLREIKSKHLMEESCDEYALSDQLIVNRFEPHLNPDESEFYYVVGQEKGSTGKQFFILAVLGFVLGLLLMTKTYFIGLTPQRLMLMHISGSFQEKSFESIAI